MKLSLTSLTLFCLFLSSTDQASHHNYKINVFKHSGVQWDYNQLLAYFEGNNNYDKKSGFVKGKLKQKKMKEYRRKQPMFKIMLYHSHLKY